uniref:ATP-dependent RNA helicase n=2 Tax=Mesocestoides corti TaxID=53468 RepID=A0A5K3EX82_MESCO
MSSNSVNGGMVHEASARDGVVGGFTIVRDKLRYRKEKVKEILPHWITTPVSCSGNLDVGIKIKKFKILNEVLRSNLKIMGIRRLFPVQSAVIPYILDFYEGRLQPSFGHPRDICISAPTGSGKTLTYILPIVHLLSACKTRVIRAVIILPVRDLAKQVAETIRSLVVGTPIRVVLLTGEESFTAEQDNVFATHDSKCVPPDIIVCTPGRLVDHIYNTQGFCLEHVRFLVIDEADRVIAEEKQDWYNIFESAVYGATNVSESNREKSVSRRSFPLPTIESHCSISAFTLQKILLSATLTHDPEPLKRFRLNFPRLFLASTSQKETREGEIDLRQDTCRESEGAKCESSGKLEETQDSPRGLQYQAPVVSGAGGVGVFSTPSGLKEFFVELIERQKPMFLAHLIKKLGHTRVLCFTNSRESTKRLAVLMSFFDNIKAGALNAGMPLQKRTRLLHSFANGEIQLLICTDAVARGIDIEDVSCVVSYEAPQSTKTYVHRVGRTARAGRPGQAYTLLLHNQIRYFKSSLKSVGKHARNFPVHSSNLRPYTSTYQKALGYLEKKFQVLHKDAFGVPIKPGSANHKAKQKTNVAWRNTSKKTRKGTTCKQLDN